MRLLDSLLVVELGTNVQDGERDQWQVVSDKRRCVPVALQEDGPPAQLRHAMSVTRAHGQRYTGLTKQMIIHAVAE